MRDPERIRPILEMVRRVWEANPDLRLGQLITNATRPTEPCREIFHIEDDRLVTGLEDLERLFESANQQRQREGTR